MNKSSRSKNSIGMPVDDWQAQSDLSTLIEARRIRKDPKRMKAVQQVARERLQEVASISAAAESDED